jgi:hypothetical protein
MLNNKKQCQLGEPCPLTNAREAGYCVTRHTPGITVEEISKETGIPLKRLMRISDRNNEAQAYPHEVAAITKATGRPEWMQFFVRAAGFEMFALPIPAADEDASLFQHTTAVVRELSEALGEIEESRRTGGSIDADECERIKRQFGDVHVASQRVVAYVETLVRQPITTFPRVAGGAR